MLKEEGKIDDDIIKKLMNWKHSGFGVHNKERIVKIDVSEYNPDASHQNNGAIVSKRSMRQTLCAVRIVVEK